MTCGMTPDQVYTIWMSAIMSAGVIVGIVAGVWIARRTR